MGQSSRHQAQNFQKKALSALVFSVWAWPVVALDLGRLQILSAIGEPLRAEIEITQASADELRTLRTQLAPSSAFNQAGMEFNPALLGVTASVQTRGNGASFIALNGQVPVQDNFLDLILETQSSSGRVVKNYALLLNSVSDRPRASTQETAQVIRPPLATLPPAVSETPQSIASVQALPSFRPTEPSSVPAISPELNAASVALNNQGVPVYRFAPIDNAQTAPGSPRPSTTPSHLQAPAVQATPRTVRQLTPSAETANTITVRPGDTASRLAMRHLGAEVSLNQMLLAMLKANPEAFIQGNVNLVKAGAVLRIPSAEEATQIPRAEARRTIIAQARDFAEYASRLAQAPLLVDSKNSREMSGKVTSETAKTEAETPLQDKLTLSKPSISGDASEAKLAAERASQDAADQLAALNKNLKDLEALSQTVSAATNTPAPVTEPSSAPVAAPPPAATAPTAAAEPAASPTSSAADTTPAGLQRLVEDKHIWAWAGALLALILLAAFWIRRKSKEPESTYAPSYDDFASNEQEPSMDAPAGQVGMPTPLSSIDLNLQTPAPNAPVNTSSSYAQPAPSMPVETPATSSEDTENSKLNLAAQLLAKGDKDLARALILSVVSSSQGDLKARAVQLLGQIR